MNLTLTKPATGRRKGRRRSDDNDGYMDRRSPKMEREGTMPGEERRADE